MLDEHHLLMNHLRQSGGDISLQTRVEEAFSKTLLISAASYYEHRLTEILVGIYLEMTEGKTALADFVRSQATGRRFSQLFNWDRPNANSFFGLFGSEFSDYMKQRVGGDQELGESARAFLELGHLRNQLVHGNYASFPLSKTVAEVSDMYQKAWRFVEGFPGELREYIAQTASN